MIEELAKLIEEELKQNESSNYVLSYRLARKIAALIRKPTLVKMEDV